MAMYSGEMVNMFTAFPSAPIILIPIVHGIRGSTKLKTGRIAH